MSTPQSQWKTTYQGATVRGVEPEGEERPLWVFSTFLRESVMAYPQGTSEEEYREFMVELNRVWNETAKTLNALPEHIPIIIKSYIELHNGWVTRKRPIDLIEVFRYREDTLQNPYIVADIALQCEGRRILLTKPNWVTSLVHKWNIKRASEDRPLLQRDNEVYHGRLTSARCKQMMKDPHVTIAQLGGPPVVHKLPGTQSMQLSTDNIAKGIEDELSEDEHVAPPRGRYGLRSKTQAAPPPVAGPSGTAPGAVKGVKKTERSGSRHSTKARKPEHEIIVLDDSDEEAAPIKKGKQRASHSRSRQKQTYKSVEFIGDESGDDEPEIEIDEEATAPDPALPSKTASKVYCANSPEYFQGEYQLSEEFMTYLGLVDELGAAQQAIIPCFQCVKHDLPCFLFLDHLSGCIGCKLSTAKRPCSLVPKISEKVYLKVPYSIFWMRHYFTDLICSWMDGSSLLVPTRNVADYNWSPGIPHSAVISRIPKDSRKEDYDPVIEVWQELCQTNWKHQWYGIPYPRAKLMWEDLASPEKESTFKDCIWYPAPLDPNYAAHLLEKFYRHLRTTECNPSWTGYDMSTVCAMMPSLCQHTPPGFTKVRKANPTMASMSFNEWLEYCANPTHHLVPTHPIEGDHDVESEEGVEGDAVEGDADEKSAWMIPHQSSSAPIEEESDNSAEKDDRPTTENGESEGDAMSRGDIGDVEMENETNTGILEKPAPQRRTRGKVIEMPPQELAAELTDEEIMDVAVSQLSLGDSSTPAVVETNELVEPAPKRRRIYEEDGIGQSGELEVVFQHQHEVHKIAVDARTAADKANNDIAKLVQDLSKLTQVVERQQPNDLDARLDQLEDCVKIITEDAAASSEQVAKLPEIVNDIRATVHNIIAKEVQQQLAQQLDQRLPDLVSLAVQEHFVRAAQPAIEGLSANPSAPPQPDIELNEAIRDAEMEDDAEDGSRKDFDEDTEMDCADGTPTASQQENGASTPAAQDDAASSTSRRSKSRASSVSTPPEPELPEKPQSMVISPISSYIQRAQEAGDAPPENLDSQATSSLFFQTPALDDGMDSTPPRTPTSTPPPLPNSPPPTTMLSALTPLPSTIASLPSLRLPSTLAPAATRDERLSTISTIANAGTSTASAPFALEAEGDSISAMLSRYNESSPRTDTDESE